MMVLLFFAVMVGATELPERVADWATGYAAPFARSYLKAIRKQAHDPDKLSEQIARRMVRRLYNILKVLLVAIVAYIAGGKSLELSVHGLGSVRSRILGGWPTRNACARAHGFRSLGGARSAGLSPLLVFGDANLRKAINGKTSRRLRTSLERAPNEVPSKRRAPHDGFAGLRA